MCGIVGVIGNSPVMQDLYDGMMIVQHRGQDAAGVVTFDGSFHLKKGYGLVRDVFKQKHISRLSGNYGIGHVRYPTVGPGISRDAQPFVVNSPYGIAMVHNGNITNFKELKKELFEKCHRHIDSSCDVEVILNVFADELSINDHKHSFFDSVCLSVEGIFKRVKGTYSVISLIANKGLVVFRDPYGIRPLIFGKKDDYSNKYMFASESAVLTSLGFDVVRNVEPGEVIWVSTDGRLESRIIQQKGHYPCIFEYIYFARPDSIIDNISVYRARINLGIELAKLWKQSGLSADVIMPVPDSSRPSAISMAFELGIPYREGLIKNKYIGRTFIMADEDKRKESVRYKLAPLRIEIENKKILLVDDSIVRGTTSKEIVRMIRENGAEKVYIAVTCPPIKFPCVYGIDMSTRGELLASSRDLSEITEYVGADYILYQTIEGMINSCLKESTDIKHFCYACMNGFYPTGDIDEKVLKEISDDRILAHKK